ncbi:MAG: CvpA family protein [Clostridiales bacterium]|nr:CvpA family protein [Clostridiales bacterium]
MRDLGQAIAFSGLINMLDIAALMAFIACVVIGYRRGLIRMVFDLAGFVLSFYIAAKLYPVISVYLRQSTNIYTIIKDRIAESLDITGVVNEYIDMGEKAVFENLSVPHFFVELLEKNNIPSVHEMLDVSGLSDYLGGFLSNMVINGISCVLVFIGVSVIMRFFVSAIHILSRLPVISAFNRLGGALAGVVMGALAVWVIVTLFTVIFVGADPKGESLLMNSYIGDYLYSNDMLIIKMSEIYYR